MNIIFTKLTSPGILTASMMVVEVAASVFVLGGNKHLVLKSRCCCAEHAKRLLA